MAGQYPWILGKEAFILLYAVPLGARVSGCPIVNTDCKSGPSEILEQGKDGRLVPVVDAGAIAQAIIETFGESVDPKMLRAGAAQFSSETMAGEYQRLLLEHQTDHSSGVEICASR